MGFGILPGDLKLFVPDYVIGTPEDCVARALEIDTHAGDTLDPIKGGSGFTPGFSDMIGFAAPMLRLPGSTLIKVPRPAVYEGGLTMQEEGFVVFHNRLRDLIDMRDANNEAVTTQTRWVLQQYDELLAQYGAQWEDNRVSKGNKTSLPFLDDLHARHDATTTYFANLRTLAYGEKSRTGTFRYTDLIYSHITHAVHYMYRARESLDAGEYIS